MGLGSGMGKLADETQAIHLIILNANAYETTLKFLPQFF